MLFSREPTPSLQKKSYMYKITIRRIRKGCLLLLSLSLSFFLSLALTLLQEWSKREEEGEKGEKEEYGETTNRICKKRERGERREKERLRERERRRREREERERERRERDPKIECV